MRKILITGGAGFIGSALIRFLCRETVSNILNIDCLNYAASLDSLRSVSGASNYQHRNIDIREQHLIRQATEDFQPDLIIHLAAETHVDRSIDDARQFVSTNVMGTFEILQAATEYWKKLRAEKKSKFRFVHVSTDEVFGTLGESGAFTESSPFAPNNPYAASKAGSDLLARAWFETHRLPVIRTNCSNNYGPFQFPEKLIPFMILNALNRKSLPIFGTGDNVRDWLHVDDHVKALWLVATRGNPGTSFNIGGRNERTNLEVVQTICRILDTIKPHREGSYSNLIEFVNDRPGHDIRYAIDHSKLTNETGWQPSIEFEDGMHCTVHWYLENEWWWQPVISRGIPSGIQGGANRY